MSITVLIGLALTFLTALLGYLQSRRNHAQISQVHVLVNSQMTAATARVVQLAGMLRDAGISVPPAPPAP